jgi:carboxyl-terminal processing protease
MHGLDWERVGVLYRRQAASAAGRTEFQRVVNRMLAELRASHLHFYTVDDFDYYFMRQVFLPDKPAVEVEHIGIMGSAQEDGFVVSAVFEDGPAARAGLQVGDRLIAVDWQQPFRSAGSFSGKAGTVACLAVRSNGEEERIVQVLPFKQTAVEAFAEATGASARVIEKDGRRIGYIHVWCMTHREILAQFEFSVREKLRDTDGMIVDLRDGYGGHPSRFDYVFFQPAMEMNVVSRGGQSVTEHFGYHQPLVAIINEGSRSAKECYAYALKKTGRARLVGTNTAGYVLGAGAVEVGDDGLLMFPTSDLRLDGQRLEGVGVAPDVEIAPRNSYTRSDAQIAAAVAEVLKQVGG